MHLVASIAMRLEAFAANGGRVDPNDVRWALRRSDVAEWLKSNDANTPRRKRLLKQLGPGLITGASDDDPSGIGTYSQAGAQLGFSIGWTMLLTFPLMRQYRKSVRELGGLPVTEFGKPPAPLL